MANILYRETTTAAIPAQTQAKGQPLLNSEIDGNFRQIKTELDLAYSATNSATNANTPQTLVKRDASGNITIATATAEKFNAAGAAAAIQVGGITVLSASRGLEQITQIDDTTKTTLINAGISAGGSGGGGAIEGVFWENDQIVSANYTLSVGKNAGTFGPVTVANGVTVTVPNGSIWTVV